MPGRCWDTVLVRNRREKLLYFLNNFVFYFICVKFFAAWALGAQSFCSKHISDRTPELDGLTGSSRGQLGGGPSAMRLGPLLFLTFRSGRRRRRGIQCYLGKGSLSLQKRVAFGRVGTLSGLAGWPAAAASGAAESMQTWGDSRQMQS